MLPKSLTLVVGSLVLTASAVSVPATITGAPVFPLQSERAKRSNLILGDHE